MINARVCWYIYSKIIPAYCYNFKRYADFKVETSLFSNKLTILERYTYLAGNCGYFWVEITKKNKIEEMDLKLTTRIEDIYPFGKIQMIPK